MKRSKIAVVLLLLGFISSFLLTLSACEPGCDCPELNHTVLVFPENGEFSILQTGYREGTCELDKAMGLASVVPYEGALVVKDGEISMVYSLESGEAFEIEFEVLDTFIYYPELEGF